MSMFSAGEMKYSTGAAYKVRSDWDCVGMSCHGNNTAGGIHWERVPWSRHIFMVWWVKLYRKFLSQQVSWWNDLAVCMYDNTSCYIYSLFRMEGKGEFTDASGRVWTGTFNRKTATGLRLKLSWVKCYNNLCNIFNTTLYYTKIFKKCFSLVY